MHAFAPLRSMRRRRGWRRWWRWWRRRWWWRWRSGRSSGGCCRRSRGRRRRRWQRGRFRQRCLRLGEDDSGNFKVGARFALDISRRRQLEAETARLSGDERKHWARKIDELDRSLDNRMLFREDLFLLFALALRIGDGDDDFIDRLVAIVGNLAEDAGYSRRRHLHIHIAQRELRNVSQAVGNLRLDVVDIVEFLLQAEFYPGVTGRLFLIEFGDRRLIRGYRFVIVVLVVSLDSFLVFLLDVFLPGIIVKDFPVATFLHRYDIVVVRYRGIALIGQALLSGLIGTGIRIGGGIDGALPECQVRAGDLDRDDPFAVALLLDVADDEILRAEDAFEPVAGDIRSQRDGGQEVVHRLVDLILMRQRLVAGRIVVQLQIFGVGLRGFR